MWLPGVALVTGAIDPSRTAEAAILAVGSLAARVRHRPRSSAGRARRPSQRRPSSLAHAVDLAFGSPLIVRSLAGPNPGFGARFFGIGNELEAILAVMVLLGAGALLVGARASASSRSGSPFVCAGAAVVIGAGRLGADVGGVITLGAGAAAAVLASLPGGVTRRAVVVALLVPVLAVAALAVIDVVTGRRRPPHALRARGGLAGRARGRRRAAVRHLVGQPASRARRR